jgi:hypothetical protein
MNLRANGGRRGEVLCVFVDPMPETLAMMGMWILAYPVSHKE